MTVDIQDPADEQGLLELFERGRKAYPAKVTGTFRRTKWLFMAVLLGIYYLMPWVRWERGLGAPDQAILVDVVHRKFYFFFIELWPQEVYYFTGLLLLAALGLFFMTTLLGRVWCGYACPQTVWTDLFVAVERWIEGDRVKRMRLDDAPWSFGKLRKKVSKHVIWLFIGLCTGGAWVFYFQDAPTLWSQMLNGEFHFTPTFWMLFLTGTTYMMAGFARENVCTYMCPYARFQGAMFDEDSLIVAYDEQRGEPRGKNEKGDCIDCLRCVAVCPTGIDIRDGQQYKCINCALCVDACNDIMAKIGKPAGLIRYNTFHNTVPGGIKWYQLGKYVRLFRPRIVFYATIITVVGTTMLGTLLTRPLLDLNVIRARNPLYITLADGSIRNAYTLHIVNKTWSSQQYTLAASGLPDLRLSTPEAAGAPDGTVKVSVAPGKVGTFRLLADVPPTAPAGSQPMEISAKTDKFEDRYATVFVVPSYDD